MKPRVRSLLQHLQVLRLHPDDLIVLHTEQQLSDAQCAAIRQQMQAGLPERLHSRVVVLTGGLKLGVLRETKRA